MKIVKIILCALIIVFVGINAYAATINIFIKVRGHTGLEGEFKEIVSEEFLKYPMTQITDNKEDSHLYLEFTMVEQDPIKLYAVGVAISYHIKDDFYSRPTSDVAQFGRERMNDICEFFVKEIDKAFLVPLRSPIE